MADDYFYYSQVIRWLPDQDINNWWFGSWGDNPNKREIIREALAQLSADFDCGKTIKTILKDLGLVGKGIYPKLTKKGRRYLYYANVYAIKSKQISEEK